jgi:hypothetical protein
MDKNHGVQAGEAGKFSVKSQGTRDSMKAQPHRRRRRTYNDLFLDELKKLSANEQKLINNNTLQKSLKWDDNPKRYRRVRDELLAEHLIIAGRGGPGGGVGLAEVPGRKAPLALKLFISYSHQDEDIKDELLKHLSPLKRLNLISDFHDRKIEPGDKWAKVISDNLANADIVVLLISIDFINSEYCYDVEMDAALDRQADGAAVVIPVIARSCIWKSTKFAPFQALPTDGKAIATWADRDDALRVVAEGIQQVAERLLSNR